jgi:hypothetical protein
VWLHSFPLWGKEISQTRTLPWDQFAATQPRMYAFLMQRVLENSRLSALFAHQPLSHQATTINCTKPAEHSHPNDSAYRIQYPSSSTANVTNIFHAFFTSNQFSKYKVRFCYLVPAKAEGWCQSMAVFSDILSRNNISYCFFSRIFGPLVLRTKNSWKKRDYRKTKIIKVLSCSKYDHVTVCVLTKTL